MHIMEYNISTLNSCDIFGRKGPVTLRSGISGYINIFNKCVVLLLPM